MSKSAFEKIREGLEEALRSVRAVEPNAATDAPKRKGGEAVVSAARIQDVTMLNIPDVAGNASESADFSLFSEAHVAETRRARAWLDSRIREAKHGCGSCGAKSGAQRAKGSDMTSPQPFTRRHRTGQQLLDARRRAELHERLKRAVALRKAGK